MDVFALKRLIWNTGKCFFSIKSAFVFLIKSTYSAMQMHI